MFYEPRDEDPLHIKTGLHASLFSGDSVTFPGLLSTNLNEGLQNIQEDSYGPLDENTYKFNSYGYRSPEYSSSNELLSLGCSQTMGMGVPEDGHWPSILAETLGVKYSNLAYGGWSIQAIILSAFAYFKKYGHPKKVALLLPDLARTKIVTRNGLIDNSIFTKKRKEISCEHVSIENGFTHGNRNGAPPKYSKAPHVLGDIIPVENSVYFSFQLLNIFLQYCNQNNIAVAWGSWDIGTESLLQYARLQGVDIDMSGHIDGLDALVRTFSNGAVPVACHLDELPLFPQTFIRGTDRFEHMGVHSHIHIAEEFSKKLTNC